MMTKNEQPERKEPVAQLVKARKLLVEADTILQELRLQSVAYHAKRLMDAQHSISDAMLRIEELTGPLNWDEFEEE